MHGGDAPLVLHLGIQRHEVVGAREALAKAVEAHSPGPLLEQRLLEFGAEARCRGAAAPARPAATTLIGVAPHELATFLGGILEARHIHAIGAMAVGGPVQELSLIHISEPTS